MPRQNFNCLGALYFYKPPKLLTFPFMRKLGLVILGISLIWPFCYGQMEEVDIKVYDFEEGLSHRNVFKIQQDTAGFIWVATINGLNRFDGYQFISYNSHSKDHSIPFDAISDMVIDDENQIWLANPDYLTCLSTEKNTFDTIKIKQGAVAARQAKIPYNLHQDQQDGIWMATYDEGSAKTSIQVLQRDSKKSKELLKVQGQYIKRPIAQVNNYYYVGAYENELWRFDREGNIIKKYEFPVLNNNPSLSRIVDLQAIDNTLWILLINGSLYYIDDLEEQFQPHPINQLTQYTTAVNALHVEDNGDIWIAGQNTLWHYDQLSKQLVDYDPSVREITKNSVTYRQIFKDRSGVTWIASDFGLIKIVQKDRLFTHYLSGGSEYCSNVYCSTRGITEDEEGRIYVSYYNSIHVIDPKANSIRLLFPANDYFNYPFGLTYFDNALWTGNGKRIDLKTLKVDTIFNKPNIDLGAVIADSKGFIWFGFRQWLYQYDPNSKKLLEFEDSQGKWDSLSGIISYLHEGRNGEYIWVGTLGHGLYKVHRKQGRVEHLHTGENSPIRLRHNQINVIYEDERGFLWLGTGRGLHRIHMANQDMRVYTSEDGLPNNFINGLLAEGDSCVWVSTDNGLCRFSYRRQTCSNFSQQDGISSNEFNRISFFKASDGRMYFGGLNGVNAFYPGPRFLQHKKGRQVTELMLTTYFQLDGEADSLRTQSYGLADFRQITLSHQDKIFGFNFALASYESPLQNQFSYILERYDKEWSPPSSVNTVRYNNIPAGTYTFKVRGKANQDNWNRKPLSIEIIIKKAYYETWWFWSICGLILMGSFWGAMRYRVYTIKARQKELERQVKERTMELEKEKEKSESLLLNILPAELAEELKLNGFAKAKRHELVTVMFSDFKGFSKISEQLEPEDLVAEIDLCFRAYDEIIERHGLEKIKTVGDAYLCVGGISSDDVDEATRVLRAALEIQEFMHGIGITKRVNKEPYFEARIGIHSGPVVAGIVGIKKFAYDIWGDTVNIAARMETNGEAGRVNISEATYQLIKDSFHCNYHGKYTENDGDDIGMYFVERVVD